MSKEWETVDVSIEMAGIRLQSPYILSSGPLSYAAEGMIKAHQAGAGAVVTKTIRLERALNPVPHIAIMNKDSLVNCEKWADSDADLWFEREIPMTKAAGAVVIASVGHTLPEAEALVARAEAAGADFIELVSYSETDMLPMLEATLERVNIPVICKLSSNYPAWKDPVKCAEDCLAIGKRFGKKVLIGAIDSVGPVMAIDIYSEKPAMGSEGGYGWLSGGAIRPISMRINYDIMRKFPDLESYGIGGVTKAEDAIEYMMAGCTGVGICSIAIIKGVEFISRLVSDLKKKLHELGYSRASQVRGLAIPNFTMEANEPTKGEQEKDVESDAKIQFRFEKETCIKCNMCVHICPYDARSLEFPLMKVDRDLCRNCSACLSVCPTRCLTGTVVKAFQETDDTQNYLGYFS